MDLRSAALDQNDAVVAFLNYIVAYPVKSTSYAREAAEALNRYWALPMNERPCGIEIVR